jgi:uncharacterized protein (DUF169 family)
MRPNIPATEIRKMGQRMIDILGLEGSPIGVRLLTVNDEVPPGAEVLKHHRYCQALMKARRQRDVLLTGENISCPAAASAFGFHPLPEMLKSGKGLVGFGIVSNPKVAVKMFEGMTRLEPGVIKQLHLFPLEGAEYVPDIVVVEDKSEKLMWIMLSYMHAMNGQRVPGSTAVLQATCVDSTIIPYLENRLNYGYGCYGCRDATDLGESETAMGFPAEFLPAIVEHLEYLSKKAIPGSRSKNAFNALMKADVTRIKACGCGQMT